MGTRRSWTGATVASGLLAGAALVVNVAPGSAGAASRTSPERLVNSITEGDQFWPDVAAMPDGRPYVVWSDTDAVPPGWIGAYGVKSVYLASDAGRASPVFDLLAPLEGAYGNPGVAAGAVPMVSANGGNWGQQQFVFRTLSTQGQVPGSPAFVAADAPTGVAGLENGNFAFNWLGGITVLTANGDLIATEPLDAWSMLSGAQATAIVSAGDGAALLVRGPALGDALVLAGATGSVTDVMPVPGQVAAVGGWASGVTVTVAREVVADSTVATARISDGRLGAPQVVPLPTSPSVTLELVTMPDGGFFVTWFDQAGVRPRIQGQYFDVDRAGWVTVAGPQFTINEFTPLGAPAAAALTDGRVAVVWESGDAALGDDRGISARILDPADVRPAVARLGSAAGVLPGGRRCFPVVGGAAVAAVNLTPVLATAPGNGLLESNVQSGVTGSNVNFGPGSVDPNVAFAPIGSDGRVCFQNSVHAGVDLVADQLGWFQAGSLAPTSVRLVDTRIGLGGERLAPSERRCFEAGRRGTTAVVNLTPVGAAGLGNGQLVSSDVAVPPTASNVNFSPGSIDPNVAFARIGSDNRVCFVNSEHTSVDLVADLVGTMAEFVFESASPGDAPVRVVDTRVGQGGGRVAASGRLCFAVAGSPGETAVLNLTPVNAAGPGHGQLVSSDVIEPPVASNVNFSPGSFDPNVAFAVIGGDDRVCFVNSEHTSVDLVADQLGTVMAGVFNSATPAAGSLRVIDTRVG